MSMSTTQLFAGYTTNIGSRESFYFAFREYDSTDLSVYDDGRIKFVLLATSLANAISSWPDVSLLVHNGMLIRSRGAAF